MTKLEFIKMWSVKARRAYWQWRAASVTKARFTGLDPADYANPKDMPQMSVLKKWMQA